MADSKAQQGRSCRGRGAGQRALDEHRLVTIGDAGAFAKRDKHTDLKVELHQRLLDLINLPALDKMSREQIEAEVGDIVAEELAQAEPCAQPCRAQAAGRRRPRRIARPRAARASAQGSDHHRHPGQRPRTAYSSSATACSSRAPVRFKDERHLVRIIQKIVSAVGRRIDESSPMVDARLADGSRVNAVVPPLALDGSLLSIRKFARVPISMERLIEIGSVPAPDRRGAQGGRRHRAATS